MSALLDALKAVSQEDLDACEAEIERLEVEISGLKAARTLMRAKLGIVADKVAAMVAGRQGKAAERRGDADVEEVPEKPVSDAAPRTYAGGESLLSQRRIAIHKYLTATITHGWFKKTSRGVELV